jgi:hypothetical protein
MRLTALITIMLSTITTAFMPSKPSVNSFVYVGDIKPTGYFDPLRLSESTDEGVIKYLREAELQHGRIAMLAAVALPLLDLTNDKLAINVLKDIPLDEQVPFWLSFGLFETARMGAGWINPFMYQNSYFKLEDGYQPGNVFKVPTDKYNDTELQKELSNGRLAMLGTLGYMAQELIQQHPIV